MRGELTIKTSWSAMGYTEETLFTLDAMPYWKQYQPNEFIQSIVHEAKRELESMDGYIRILREHGQISSIAAQELNNETTVERLCDIILRREAKLLELLDIAWEYTKSSPNT
jgi:hypothetical protein